MHLLPGNGVSGAGAVLSELHRTHYHDLVGLAAIYLADRGDCEDAVQESFVRVWLGWDRVRDPEKVLVYLRRAVLNEAKSQLRHRGVVRRHRADEARTASSSEDCCLRDLADRRIISAVRLLSGRQRECVVLRFYLDLSEKETGDVLGIGPGAVKQHVSRAKRKLARKLRGIEQ